MNIAINIDKKYVNIAACMLFSLTVNNNDNICIYVLNTDLDVMDFEILNKNLQQYSNRVEIFDIKVNDDIFPSSISKLTKRWSKAVFYRLLVCKLLPESIDRLLYLDTDIIINSDIAELYNIDFDNNYIVACEDTNVNKNYQNDIRINLKTTTIYFNSGVILFNLEEIRKKNILTPENISNVLNKYKNILFPDQDVLNILFENKTKLVDFRVYNFLCSKSRYTEKELKKFSKKAKIFHYGGDGFQRPWNYYYVGRFGNVFWKYAKETSLKDSKEIEWKINKLIRPVLIPIYYIRINILKIKDRMKGL